MSRKLAIVGPRSFSYLETIADTINSRGIHTEFFDERFENTVLTKVFYRLGLIQKYTNWSDKHFDKIADKIVKNQFTDVLLISVEVSDRRFVEILKQQGIKVHLYMWDSSKNKGRYLSYIDLLDGKGSFEPADCKRYGMKYIPLFAEDMYSEYRRPTPTAGRDVDISFCGTLHSNRAKSLSELADISKAQNLIAVLWLFFHAKWLLVLRGMLQSAIFRFIKQVSTKGYSKHQIAGLMMRSKCVFDMGHPDQGGLTARTFETLRSGARLITNNGYAAQLPLSLANRVVVISEVNDIRKIDFEKFEQLPKLTEQQDHFLSISRFIDDLLDVVGIIKQ